MTVTLDKFKSTAEIQRCVDIYRELNDESFITTDRRSSIASLTENIIRGNIARVIRNGEEIVGFLLAERSRFDYNSLTCIGVKYYVSNLKGRLAASAVWIAHAHLVDIAERERIPVLVSQCSSYDTDQIFCKLLQKKGWDVRGYTAIYKTKYYRRVDATN